MMELYSRVFLVYFGLSILSLSWEFKTTSTVKLINRINTENGMGKNRANNEVAKLKSRTRNIRNIQMKKPTTNSTWIEYGNILHSSFKTHGNLTWRDLRLKTDISGKEPRNVIEKRSYPNNIKDIWWIATRKMTLKEHKNTKDTTFLQRKNNANIWRTKKENTTLRSPRNVTKNWLETNKIFNFAKLNTTNYSFRAEKENVKWTEPKNIPFAWMKEVKSFPWADYQNITHTQQPDTENVNRTEPVNITFS
ncbi:uncharacterized protein LOC111085702 isoform X2 [Limulus polyphemus]|uniref:Uncharacterized protein LOC111085702 isoform X2 n=1 Tax=Limulus polyphemus TaxID=6850 RepID=A0ABM1SC93_LIMPO|nr:uncharacterized protein LOC111085702 isoform X2 [Limulus polyphemus]